MMCTKIMFCLVALSQCYAASDRKAEIKHKINLSKYLEKGKGYEARIHNDLKCEGRILTVLEVSVDYDKILLYTHGSRADAVAFDVAGAEPKLSGREVHVTDIPSGKYLSISMPAGDDTLFHFFKGLYTIAHNKICDGGLVRLKTDLGKFTFSNGSEVRLDYHPKKKNKYILVRGGSKIKVTDDDEQEKWDWCESVNLEKFLEGKIFICANKTEAHAFVQVLEFHKTWFWKSKLDLTIPNGYTYKSGRKGTISITIKEMMPQEYINEQNRKVMPASLQPRIQITMQKWINDKTPLTKPVYFVGDEEENFKRNAANGTNYGQPIKQSKESYSFNASAARGREEIQGNTFTDGIGNSTNGQEIAFMGFPAEVTNECTTNKGKLQKGDRVVVKTVITKYTKRVLIETNGGRHKVSLEVFDKCFRNISSR